MENNSVDDILEAIKERRPGNGKYVFYDDWVINRNEKRVKKQVKKWISEEQLQAELKKLEESERQFRKRVDKMGKRVLQKARTKQN